MWIDTLTTSLKYLQILPVPSNLVVAFCLDLVSDVHEHFDADHMPSLERPTIIYPGDVTWRISPVDAESCIDITNKR